jgi:membrane protein
MSLWTRGGLSWTELGRRLFYQIYEDEVFGRCAELAYFFLFSIFPLLLFLTTLLGYVAKASVQARWNLFAYIARVSPSRDITALLSNTLHEITEGRGGAKLSLSLVAAVWVASNGMIALTRALNKACGLKETRPWWTRRIVAVVLTVTFSALVVSGFIVLFLGEAIGEAIASRLGIGSLFALAWRTFQWPLALVFLLLSFEMVYNYAPNLGGGHHREWATPGAVTGVVLWLGATFGLRLYLGWFHTVSTAYGSLGAVILLLVWFYLTGFALLMGGEVNSEIARAWAETARAQGIDLKALKANRRRLRLRRLRRQEKAKEEERETEAPAPDGVRR